MDIGRYKNLCEDPSKVGFEDILDGLARVLRNSNNANMVGGVLKSGGKDYISFMDYLADNPKAVELLGDISVKLQKILNEVDNIKNGLELSKDFPDCLFNKGVDDEIANALRMPVEKYRKKYKKSDTKNE